MSDESKTFSNRWVCLYHKRMSDAHFAVVLSTQSGCDARQVRLSSVEERAMKAERERKETVAALERQLTAARAEVLDWRRELAAAEAERDRLLTDRKALAKRASSGSLYAGYGGTPKARGVASRSRQAVSSSSILSLCAGGHTGSVLHHSFLSEMVGACRASARSQQT